MRRVAPFALVAALIASAYPLLRGQEVQVPKDALPNPATSGAIVIEPPVEVGPGAAPSADAATRWEYLVISGPELIKKAPDDGGPEADLNALGDDGWRLCATYGTNPVAFVFTRPKRPDAPAAPK